MAGKAFPDSLLVNGAPYNVFRKDRLSSHGGGLCILAKRNLKIVIKNSISPDVLMIHCISHLINFNFVRCYIVIDLHKLIVSLLLISMNVWLPNVNWNTLSHNFSNPSCLGFQIYIPFTTFITENYFSPFVFKPTRGSNLLDQILCNDPCAIFSVQVDSPFSSSDHNSITFNLLLPTDPQLNVNNTDFPRFDYRNADWNCINAEFCKINWIHQIDQLDCDQV